MLERPHDELVAAMMAGGRTPVDMANVVTGQVRTEFAELQALPALTNQVPAGDRAAIAVQCTYPGGESHVRCNALLHIRDGKIVRWDAVQAWDE